MANGASLTSGIGSVNSMTLSGSQLTVNLTGVANAQQITLLLSGVNDGANTSKVGIPMSSLLGDTSDNGVVNASDLSQTKAQVGQTVTSANFRSDVNANGTINASDVSIVKSQLSTGIAEAAQEIQSSRFSKRDSNPTR